MRLTVAVCAVAMIVGGTAAVTTTSAASPTSAATTRVIASPKLPGATIVSLGDSFISGEGGAWAGNSNVSHLLVDALGADAYWDDRGGEKIPGCHRSRTAPIHIGGSVRTVNLACSGATTASKWSGKEFKPGIDFYNDGRGNIGQAAMLRELARKQDVELVVVSIGGNDLHFADIIADCVKAWLLSASSSKSLCQDDPEVRAYLSNTEDLAIRIANALRNVRAAMRQAGYAARQYDILVMTYPSPLPPAALARDPEAGPDRLVSSGCPVWDEDLDWANDTVLPLLRRAISTAVRSVRAGNVSILDVTSAFDGNRLCERGAELVGSADGVSDWRAPGAADRSEWVSQIRVLSTLFGPYQAQESLHPNYWGQQALQSCIREAWNNGDVRGGICRRTTTATRTDPVMSLRPARATR